jgi:hypothetical protein
MFVCMSWKWQIWHFTFICPLIADIAFRNFKFSLKFSSFCFTKMFITLVLIKIESSFLYHWILLNGPWYAIHNILGHINSLALTFDHRLWKNLLPDKYKFFLQHFVIASIHLWKVSCLDMKVMRRYDFFSVSGLMLHWLVRQDVSCCNVYRHAAGHHDSSNLSVHTWFQQS